jgi:hypothetical protein
MVRKLDVRYCVGRVRLPDVGIRGPSCLQRQPRTISSGKYVQVSKTKGIYLLLAQVLMGVENIDGAKNRLRILADRICILHLRDSRLDSIRWTLGFEPPEATNRSKVDARYSISLVRFVAGST